MQFPLLSRRQIKSDFILCLLFINLVYSSVNSFCFTGTEDFRKTEKEIQH